MRTELELVFETYGIAKNEAFSAHAAAEFLRHDLPESLRDTLSTKHPDLLVKASPGKGGWTDTPWVAVLDPLVTATPQHGIYVVYLFASSLDRLYLSLNQGITVRRNSFRTQSVREQLKETAVALRRCCSAYYPERFPSESIDLAPTNSTSRASFYETGHAFGKAYQQPLPEESVLMADLDEMIRLYRLSTSEGLPDEMTNTDDEDGSEPGTLLEAKRLRYHRRIERNQRLVKLVKKRQGKICKACGFDYQAAYGELGKGYIEAHHNVPLSQIPVDTLVPQDPLADFTVLCASCHRMVHRRLPPLSLDEIKEVINRQKGESLFSSGA